jgi:hypothetical protein
VFIGHRKSSHYQGLPQKADTTTVTLNGILVRMRIVALLALAGCTTLGPMPSTTAVSAIPAGKPGAEAQLGIAPGFHLSSSVAKPRGSAMGQAAVLVEPDHWVKIPGLIVGGRVFGKGEDTPVEPMIGYRHAFTKDFASAIVGYGTSKRAKDRLASYHGFRMGVEGAADAKIVGFTRWLSLHAQLAGSITRIVASGKYCVDAKGIGKDCDENNPEANVMVNGEARGWYPSTSATIALDVGRHGSSWFHSLRAALVMSLGRMPHVEAGEQEGDSTYFALGLLATLGFGE